ncbi:MAG: zinc ribbon domain-containing protein [Verrucomicrobia bacterium]|nr:MAG: zinc ribbon domain-containing protein [Verrucomicrobiota bacterium]
MSTFRPPGDCPNCGEAVPARSAACPHCGATPDAGWNEAAAYDGLDLPDSAFEDDDAPRPRARPRKPRLHPGWILVALALLAALTAWIWLG